LFFSGWSKWKRYIPPKRFRETGGLRRLCKLFDYWLLRTGDQEPNNAVIEVDYKYPLTVEVGFVQLPEFSVCHQQLHLVSHPVQPPEI
jgi:hypothetical protein